MSFLQTVDKLGLINSALAETGDNLVNAADNGSDEWNACSPGYETWLGYIMASHSWGYATQVVTLQPSPTAPSDTQWDTQYPIPSDCIHILWLKINQDGSDPVNSTTSQFVLYDIMGTQTGPVIVVNAQGGPPPPSPAQTPAAITLKYVSNAGSLCDSTNGSPTFLTALKHFVMSSIYRGLHEDTQESERMLAMAKGFLQEARTRYDQQLPKRSFFNSRIELSRRVRRPYPPVGLGGWGGGTPG